MRRFTESAWRSAGSLRVWLERSARLSLGGLIGCVPAMVGCSSLAAGAAPERPNIAHVSLFAYPWQWTDDQGAALRFASFRGEPLIVTAIYTSCIRTCPRTIARLRQLETTPRGHASEFLLVTLDPSEDTPERLHQFREQQGLPARWHLLCGTPGETQQLTDALDIHVLDEGAHLVHDGRIVFFDGQGMPTRSLGGFALDQESAL